MAAPDRIGQDRGRRVRRGPGARAEGGKAFYTTPLKALSNQKYGDLVRRHGAERGRAADRRQRHQRRRPGRGHDHRGAAQHDLRRLGQPRRAALRGPRRGPLPPERLPGPGLGGGHHPQPRRRWTWSACRPRCPTPRSWPTGSAPCGARPTAVIEDRRPVELHNLYLLGDRSSERLLLLPDPGRRPAQPRGERPRQQDAAPRRACGAGPGAGCSRPAGSRWSSCSAGARHAPGDLLHLQPGRLRRRRRPVRAGGTAADHAPRSAARSGPSPRPTSTPCPTTTCGCSTTATWMTGLEAGFAAHHAGMVPPFKEAVEACFAAGLVKVVFATETLSLGINMPARSVVIEKLTKFTGERHEFLTPGRVHPAHRAGRPAGHRRRRLRRRAVVPVRALRPGGRAGRHPDLRPHQQLPADLQHGRQPGAALPARHGPPPPQPVVRPVPGRQRRRPPRGPARAHPGGRWPRPGPAAACDAGRRRGVPGPAAGRARTPAASADR